MAEDHMSSPQTLQGDSQRTESPSPQTLDLSQLPPIFVSATHFETSDLHMLEEDLVDCGATLTYDLGEAKVVLSKVQKKRRIAFDLRAKGLWTEEVTTTRSDVDVVREADGLPSKRRKLANAEAVAGQVGKSQAEAIIIDDESTASEAESAARQKPDTGIARRIKEGNGVRAPAVQTPPPTEPLVSVVDVTWFTESRKAGTPLPLHAFVTYQCRQVKPPPEEPSLKQTPTVSVNTRKPNESKTAAVIADKPGADILERANEDAEHAPKSFDRFGKRKFGYHMRSGGDASWAAGSGKPKEYAHLLHKTTTEDEQGYSSDLPEMPDWVKQGVKYACQRSTPGNSPNERFIDLLKKIKLARLLTNDEIGVRAYSTSIASLAAYPYKIVSPREIMALPGCDQKIANLFVEWANTGTIKAVEDVDADDDLKVLRLFWEIWGVGATTAREFYFDRGWRDLDDIVEFGWSTLTRVQQIGVKYYEEFLDPIPRAEVEEIGRIIHRHAVKVRDDGVQSLIVGGYRRGKQACGDVDMIVSHIDEGQTLNIVNDIVASLEEEGWITHTLLLSLNNSNRDQQTLPFRAEGGGHGFDSLDKALVVWQDPDWPTKDADLASNPKSKNPNIHRRVDIIISPWRTVGCAVTGWSGGTTFQRDLRRYAKHAHRWKFDSSGVRDRGNGEVVDVEGYYGYSGRIGSGRAKTMVEAEKRVFEGMGLVYREPSERCTG
ncbi:hypothetical protein BAUCODRAFT_85556 [Baudoinia panamericana UAMH 10762]|uniref:DNA-directed DNA polymerase n=1 Tax=Baudoinia panamericana (strain UAMH 10762) TaxID=717646 RepID=M2MR12_BAUPA|nr:uncharacterized protein BAUCODRAFT_85556 [Baudoinia panamericana UAMH 10762]EMC99281.1 hypothetical protein BAUCODRAFT_85556 [Baudoinia panamericana UAMH 10762]